MLRFAVSANSVGAPVGDICEIIGHKEVVNRLQNCIDYISNLTDD